MTASSKRRSERITGPLPATEVRYREALALYRSTTLAVKRICALTHVKYGGFQTYLRKYHRDLLLARYGVQVPVSSAVNVKLRSRCGQTPAAHAKYEDAVLACDAAEYIELNISQIARMFGLSPTGLGNQLRAHYPEILDRRERTRRRLGVADNQQRGVRPWCREQYAGAVELLRTTDCTIEEAADRCGVSYSGLHEHLLFYHKDVVRQRSDKRERGKMQKIRGVVMGNGNRHEPSSASIAKYREAVHLYETTALTLRQIVEKTGVSLGGLRNHLRNWHRELIFARRGAEYEEGASLSDTKRYKKATAAKYAAAIERLRTGDLPTARVAAEFGLNPEIFRMYLREHEPELHARWGMVKTATGKTVLQRSQRKYAEAIRLYRTTSESLKAIACRLDLNYNSLGGYIRRNHPELIRNRQQRAGDAKASQTQVGIEESVHVLVIT